MRARGQGVGQCGTNLGTALGFEIDSTERLVGHRVNSQPASLVFRPRKRFLFSELLNSDHLSSKVARKRLSPCSFPYHCLEHFGKHARNGAAAALMAD